jgi:hypothetical protein
MSDKGFVILYLHLYLYLHLSIYIKNSYKSKIRQSTFLLLLLSFVLWYWGLTQGFWACVPSLEPCTQSFCFNFSDKVSHFCPGQPRTEVLCLLSNWYSRHEPSHPALIFLSTFLLVCINCTKEFHHDIFINSYNVL